MTEVVEVLDVVPAVTRMDVDTVPFMDAPHFAPTTTLGSPCGALPTATSVGPAVEEKSPLTPEPVLEQAPPSAVGHPAS